MNKLFASIGIINGFDSCYDALPNMAKTLYRVRTDKVKICQQRQQV